MKYAKQRKLTFSNKQDGTNQEIFEGLNYISAQLQKPSKPPLGSTWK